MRPRHPLPGVVKTPACGEFYLTCQQPIQIEIQKDIVLVLVQLFTQLMNPVQILQGKN